MRRSRLFLATPLSADSRVELSGERAHYLRTVLRLRVGDELLVFDGSGGQYHARVAAFGRDAAHLDVGRFDERDVESPLCIDLGLGISRGERMDLAIQKAVELGVSSIVPLSMARSVVRLDDERRASRTQHWRGIVESACEQCGRTQIPELAEPQPFARWLSGAAGRRILLDPTAAIVLQQLEPPTGSVTLLSGPEGGFSSEEREHALAAGFIAVRLGPRILRAETAVLAALTAVQLLWGDLGSSAAPNGPHAWVSDDPVGPARDTALPAPHR